MSSFPAASAWGWLEYYQAALGLPPPHGSLPLTVPAERPVRHLNMSMMPDMVAVNATKPAQRSVPKGAWSKEEDETVMRLVGLYGPTR